MNIPQKQKDEIVKMITEITNKRLIAANNGYNKVDENTIRYLNSALTYTYYILSLTAACIAFIISLTIHEKINHFDWLIILSLLLFVLSFFFGLTRVNLIMKMMLNFSYFILGESIKKDEISIVHKNVVDDLGNESSKLLKQPLFYFVLGILIFICWYIIKIF